MKNEIIKDYRVELDHVSGLVKIYYKNELVKAHYYNVMEIDDRFSEYVKKLKNKYIK